MRGVCPSVAEVKIDINTQPSVLRPLGQVDVIGQVVCAPGGIHPHPLADRVDTAVSENVLDGLGSTVHVLVRDASLFFHRYR